MSAMRLLWSPWEDELFQLVSGASTSVDLAVAYIRRATARELVRALPDGVDLRVLTRCKTRDFVSGIADVGTFRFLEGHSRVKVKIMPDLHAKLYVVDGRRAILSSGNLTRAGLGAGRNPNEEAGLFLDNPSLVRAICGRWNEWWGDGTLVDNQFVRDLSEAVPERPKRTQGAKRIERAISKLLARARPEPGRRVLFSFSFPIRKTFLNHKADHPKNIPAGHYEVVSEEHLAPPADLPKRDPRVRDYDVEVVFPDRSAGVGNIHHTRDGSRKPRYRFRIPCALNRPCAMEEHFQIGQKLHVEVTRVKGRARVDLCPEERS